jgi:hypothetical protein
VGIQHVTLATANLKPMIDFYLALSFRLSDRMGGVFAWLRSNVAPRIWKPDPSTVNPWGGQVPSWRNGRERAAS